MTTTQPASGIFNPSVERLSREGLLGLQARRLRQQVAYLWQNNAFYRRRWQAAGVSPDQIQTVADYVARVPLIRKADLIADQEAQPPFGERLGVPRDALILTHITSGTSGKGQEAYGVTNADLHYGGQCWAYGLHWAGVRKGDTTFNLFPFGTFAAGTSFHEGARMLGTNNFSVAVLYDTRTLLERMRRFAARFVIVTPPYLLRLVAQAREFGHRLPDDFPDLRAIMVATEPYPIPWALDMQALWGATLHEMYGSTQQLTQLASTCELGAVPNGRRGFLHALEHLTLVEVLDPQTERQVAPGEAGELVISTLGREASPVMRYATGDRVTWLDERHCPCGRPFAGFEAGTISRYDDMLKIKGVNVWPAAVDAVVLARPEVDEYNARVYIAEAGREEVVVSVEFVPDLPAERQPAILQELERELHYQTGLHMRVDCPPGGVRRFEFKSRRWLDERQQGLDVKAL